MSEQTSIAEVERRLTITFGHFPPDRIAAAVQKAHTQFAQSPIRDFVPLLVERRARAELALGDRSVLATAG